MDGDLERKVENIDEVLSSEKGVIPKPETKPGRWRYDHFVEGVAAEKIAEDAGGRSYQDG